MVRTRTLVVAGLGAVVSAVLGSGLFAVLSDSVTSNGNEFSSGTYAVQPGAHDVKAALLPDNPSPPCDAQSMLGDGPLPAAISAQVLDLTGGNPVFQLNDSFCVRNNSQNVGQLRVSVANVLDFEVTCEASESAAGDATCDGSGMSAGELSSIVRWQMTPWDQYTSTSCGPTQLLTFDANGTGIVDPDLGSFETCRVYLTATLDPMSSETQRLLAQTDRVQFDIVFTLEDIPTP